MGVKSGVWIDSKKALIVKLTESGKSLKIIESGIESREREPGEGRSFGRFANQFLSTETRKKRRLINQEKPFFQSVLRELKDCDELVLFGPSNTKIKLYKEIKLIKDLKFDLKELEDADAMTDNQVKAWVGDYYNVV